MAKISLLNGWRSQVKAISLTETSCYRYHDDDDAELMFKDRANQLWYRGQLRAYREV